MNPLKTHWRGLLMVTGLLFPQVALAHAGHLESSFSGGFSHPLSGLDHVLAMGAVGLWAFQQGGRALWSLPMSFMGMMTVGAVLSLGEINLPAVEFMILASVVLLGAMVLLNRKIPTLGASALVGLFALFHGHAHLSEMGLDQSAFLYSSGFLLGTGVLHAAGILIGGMVLKASALQSDRWIRGLGGVVSATGLLLFMGML